MVTTARCPRAMWSRLGVPGASLSREGMPLTLVDNQCADIGCQTILEPCQRKLCKCQRKLSISVEKQHGVPKPCLRALGCLKTPQTITGWHGCLEALIGCQIILGHVKENYLWHLHNFLWQVQYNLTPHECLQTAVSSRGGLRKLRTPQDEETWLGDTVLYSLRKPLIYFDIS